MPRIKGERSVYLGVDPGKFGGLAILGMGDPRLVRMPDTLRDLWDVIVGVDPTFAVVERVGGYVAGNKLPGSSMFNFGAGFGAIEAFLIASQTPYELITPQRWQKGLGIPTRGGKEKGEHKRSLKAFADKLFPDAEGITLKTCDALLISEYCRRYREGKLNA